MRQFDILGQVVFANDVESVHLEKVAPGKCVLCIEHMDGASSRLVISEGETPISSDYFAWLE